MTGVTGLRLDDALALGRLDAHGQAALVARGEVSPAELVEAAILRIEALDGAINAVCHRAFAAARARAAEPPGPGASGLAGVPYLLKDSLPYPGMPAYAGSRSRTDAPATHGFALAQRFDAAGLAPVGKSTMAEFGLLVSNETLRFGPTRNPWDLARSPGGSSGGAAAAVAAGLTPLAHGSDAAGSIRVPAAACGVVGLKASRGANLRARASHWLDDLLCADGLIARSVRDAAWGFALADPLGRPMVETPSRRRLRIGLMLATPDGLAPQPEVAEAVTRAARLCEALGHAVEPAAPPPEAARLLTSLLETLWPSLGGEAVEECRAAFPDQPIETLLEPWTLALAERHASTSDAERQAARADLAVAAAIDAARYQRFDVILSPATTRPSALTGELSPALPYRQLTDAFRAFAPYTPLQNMAGSPAITLPLFPTPGGLPVGAMFAARQGEDQALLALAYELEAAQPWAQRWPSLAAA